MKRRFTLLLVILAFGGVGFGQVDETKPVATFRTFWGDALEGKPENAKRLVADSSLSDENLESIGQSLGIIAAEQIKLTELKRRDISGGLAFFLFEAVDKAGRNWQAEVFLLMENSEWKVLFLYLLEADLRPKDYTKIHKGYPINKDCPKCI
jgi:hypothetical protein